MTKPLTGYKKEIAILHAEARLDSELIEEFKGLANKYKQSIERVRELAEELRNKPPFVNYTAWACSEEIIKALDGEQQ